MSGRKYPRVFLGDFLTELKTYLEIEDSVRYKRARNQWYGKGIILRDEIWGSDIKTKQQKVVREGQFVVAEIDAKEGSFGIVPENLDGAIVSSHYYVFKVDEAKCSLKWLNTICKSNYFQPLVIAQGSTNYSSIRPDQVLKLEIPLPPLDEQRRIVDRIEPMAARFNEVLSLREESSDHVDKLAFVTARRIFQTLNCKVVALGELVDTDRNGIQTGPFGAQLGTYDFVENGHPIITIGNVQYSGLKTENIKFVSEEKAEQLSRFFVTEGDILFARMGTVGRCCVVTKDAEGWLYNYHLIRVALDKSRVEPKYIHWLIRASSEIEQSLSSKIRGATREGVNSKIVSSLPCRVPTLFEQRKIVEYLDNLQKLLLELRTKQADTRKEIDALMPSILEKAFKGEL